MPGMLSKMQGRAGYSNV